MNQIYTIGHSNHTEKEFLNLLVNEKIQVLIDVRSNPTSRWAPFSTRENLEKVLKLIQISYLYLGNILGGHPNNSDNYNSQTQKVDYETMRKKESFKEGIKKVLELLKKDRLCLMCAEEDPANCHRNLLVAASLRQEGIIILHIRGDGRIQTDEDLWKEQARVPVNQYSLPL